MTPPPNKLLEPFNQGVERVNSVAAVTLDFFNTLIFHREGRGRGRALMEFLEGRGFRPRPWEHRFLHEIFVDHGRAYTPSASPQQRDAYYSRIAERVSEVLRLERPVDAILDHREAIWEIVGPSCFEVFPEVRVTLRHLNELGLPLALISNWQSGVRHYCVELGLAGYFDHILGSADLGSAKPDRRIFDEASSRLGVDAALILHVGDSPGDDVAGALAAGFQVCWINRGDEYLEGVPAVRGLDELPDLIAPEPRS